jgi:micrococcal nuclease
MFNKIFCCCRSDEYTVNYTGAKNYLEKIEYKDTEEFIPPVLYAKVIKIYDGDTITVAAKLPFKGSPLYRFSVRLNGIDSPEIKGNTPTEKALAVKSRDALNKLIFGKVIELKNNSKEKYGRLLSDVYLQDLHVNKWMLDNKLAVHYDGGKKIKPENWE